MGGGAKMFPPQGPPGPETHPHASFALDTLSQLAPKGHDPPQVPVASLPHGATHNSAGPGQHVCSPAALKHMQTCSHSPSSHRSAVQELPSSQSRSVVHSGVGVGCPTATH